MIGIDSNAIALIYILILFLILCCSIWLIVSIIKKYTIGKIISTLLILILLYPFFDNLYSAFTLKNDIKEDLRTLNLELDDNFDVIENSMSDNFLGKRVNPKIEISNKDRMKLIGQIVTSENYMELKNENDYQILRQEYYNSKLLYNFKYPYYYSRKINTKIENKLVVIDLKIDLRKDILEYEKWEK